MANQDQQFLNALQFIGQAGQQYGLSLAMQRANQQAKDIRANMEDDLQQRAALRDLAQFTTMNIAAGGGNQQQLAAIQQMLPPVPSNAEQAILLGQLNGDKALARIGQEAIEAQQKREMDKLRLQAEIMAGRQERSIQAGLQRDAAKAELGRGMSNTDANKITEIDSGLARMTELTRRLETDASVKNFVGPIAGRVPSFVIGAEEKDFRDMLSREMLAYRKAITGVAGGEKEMKAIESVTLNPTDTIPQLKAKLKTLQMEGSRLRGIQLSNLKKAGFNTRGFGTDEQSAIKLEESPNQLQKSKIESAVNWD